MRGGKAKIPVRKTLLYYALELLWRKEAAGSTDHFIKPEFIAGRNACLCLDGKSSVMPSEHSRRFRQNSAKLSINLCFKGNDVSLPDPRRSNQPALSYMESA
jgi:hypothetical protein